MKTKTLTILYGLVAVLALGVLVAKQSQNQDSLSSAKYERGHKPFANLPAGEIAQVEITDGDMTSTIHIHDGKWSVKERQNYPADFSALQSLIRELSEITIAQSLEAGATYDARFGMDLSSDDPDQHGTVITLKKSDDQVITTLRLGKAVDSGEQDQMAMLMGGGAKGQHIRLDDDADAVYVINSTLNGAKSHPKNWLAKDFIKVANLSKVSLTQPNSTDLEWEVEEQNGTFTLLGDIPEGKELNTGALSSIGNLFQYARFDDILSEKAAQGLIDHSKTQTAHLKTKDGFSYQIEIASKVAPQSKNKIVKIQTSAKLNEKRPPVEGESAEQATQAEAQFSAELEGLKKKLAQEQRINGVYFEVSEYTVQALLKSRNDLLQAPQPAQPGQRPGSVTSPPFRFGGQ